MKNPENNMISLRKLIRADAGSLALLANNRKIYDNVRDFFPYPYSIKNAEEFIDWCGKENPPVTFAIEYGNELAGVIGIIPQSDVYRRSAELGYWIGEPFWNKGITTEAVRLMIDYAFHKLKLVRMFTGVFEYNKASRRVLEKSGFSLEGIFKKSVIKNGVLYDEYRFGLVNDEVTG